MTALLLPEREHGPSQGCAVALLLVAPVWLLLVLVVRWCS